MGEEVGDDGVEAIGSRSMKRGPGVTVGFVDVSSVNMKQPHQHQVIVNHSLKLIR